MKRREFIMLLGGVAFIFIGQLPVFAQTFHTYRCHDGSEFIVAFYEGDKRAHMQLNGKAITLSKRITLSGAHYSKGNITLRITKTATILKRGKNSTYCMAE